MRLFVKEPQYDGGGPVYMRRGAAETLRGIIQSVNKFEYLGFVCNV